MPALVCCSAGPWPMPWGLSAGDTVFISARDRHGVENLVDVTIRGIFHLGYPVMDKYLAFMDLASASFLLDLDNQVNRVVVRLKAGVDPGRFLAGRPRCFRPKANGSPGSALPVPQWLRWRRIPAALPP
jgi:hypothetical protein